MKNYYVEMKPLPIVLFPGRICAVLVSSVSLVVAEIGWSVVHSVVKRLMASGREEEEETFSDNGI